MAKVVAKQPDGEVKLSLNAYVIETKAQVPRYLELVVLSNGQHEIRVFIPDPENHENRRLENRYRITSDWRIFSSGDHVLTLSHSLPTGDVNTLVFGFDDINDERRFEIFVADGLTQNTRNDVEECTEHYANEALNLKSNNKSDKTVIDKVAKLNRKNKLNGWIITNPLEEEEFREKLNFAFPTDRKFDSDNYYNFFVYHKTEKPQAHFRDIPDFPFGIAPYGLFEKLEFTPIGGIPNVREEVPVNNLHFPEPKLFQRENDNNY